MRKRKGGRKEKERVKRKREKIIKFIVYNK